MVSLLETSDKTFHGERYDYNIKTSAYNRWNKVKCVQDIFAFLNNAVLAKEDNHLFERITLEINLFLYIQNEQDLVLNFYRFLKLWKTGTPHGCILSPLIFERGRSVCMPCIGGGRGKGAKKKSFISHNLTFSTTTYKQTWNSKKKEHKQRHRNRTNTHQHKPIQWLGIKRYRDKSALLILQSLSVN